MTQPSAPASQADNAEKEWESCRDVLGKFDDRIHDLRKIGFTFLTALLTAQSLLIPSNVGTTPLPSAIKLTVMVATLLLVVTLRLLEKNYELFQKAAATRAMILERTLNIEVTETISDRSRSDHFSFFVTVVYFGFALAAGILGYFILLPSYELNEVLYLGFQLWRVRVLLLFVAITIISLFVIGRQGLNFTHKWKNVQVDWTFDRLECKKDEWVRITLTNLNEKNPVSFERGDFVWEIKCEDPTYTDWSYLPPQLTPITIAPYSSYTWFWQATKIPKVPGAYKVFVPTALPRRKFRSENRPKFERAPLRRKLVVWKS